MYHSTQRGQGRDGRVIGARERTEAGWVRPVTAKHLTGVAVVPRLQSGRGARHPDPWPAIASHPMLGVAKL